MADYLGEESAKKVQYFPEGSLLNTMTISIIDSEKRYTDILKEPYTVYLIETKWVRVTSNFAIVPIFLQDLYYSMKIWVNPWLLKRFTDCSNAA